MLGYTYLHGCKLVGSKVFNNPNVSVAYQFVSMILQCTGGGILVPLFINGIPVPLSTDSYPIAIFTSFLIHSYFPVIHEVMNLSPLFKVGFSQTSRRLRETWCSKGQSRSWQILTISPCPLSNMQGGVIILYESMRSFVVCKFTLAAASAIAPSGESVNCASLDDGLSCF